MNSNQFTNNDFMPMSEEQWSTPVTQPESQLTFFRHECPFCGAAYLILVSPLNLLYASYQQTPNGRVPMAGSLHQCPYCFMSISNSSWIDTPAGGEFGLQDMGDSMPSRFNNPCIADKREMILDSKHDTVTTEDLTHIGDGSDQHQTSNHRFKRFSSRLFSSSNSPLSDWVSAQCGHPSMGNRHSSVIGATPPPFNYDNLQAIQQAPFVITSTPIYQPKDTLLPTQRPSQTAHQKSWQTGAKDLVPPPPAPSLGCWKILPSNGHTARLNPYSTGLSDPPDLYAALREEKTAPPPEDMNPEDPEMIPCEQELRCEGDLYTPRWVRGHGNKREGWCGICKPGRWLGLKNSAFWYDKQFSHGISAATGSSFQEPQDKRCLDGSWEGRRKLPGSDMLISVTHSRQWNAGLIARALTPAKPKTKV
ncbi:hypothetical protein ACKLNR_014544 [Fusarium oxysporum f. sp. zingiberi]